MNLALGVRTVKKPSQTPILSNPNHCSILAPNTICLDNNTSVKGTMQKQSLPLSCTETTFDTAVVVGPVLLHFGVYLRVYKTLTD